MLGSGLLSNDPQVVQKAIECFDTIEALDEGKSLLKTLNIMLFYILQTKRDRLNYI